MVQLQPPGDEHHHTDAAAREHLLVFQVAVSRHEHLKTSTLSTVKQLPVQHPRPTLSPHGPHGVARQFARELARQILIQQHPPRR